MTAQITTEDAVHDFTEGAFTPDSNLSVCKLSISQHPPVSACNGDGENIMGVDKDNRNINASDHSGVSKHNDGWKKVTNEVVDATETSMPTTCPKLVQDIQMKKPSKSRRKRENKKVVLSLGLLQFTRRKRSKRVRSKTWGVLENIAPARITPPTSEKLKKSRRKHDDNSIAIRSAEKSKETKRFMAGPICLKVKFGKDSIMDIITKVEDKNGIPKVTYEKAFKDASALLEKREPESIKSKLFDGNSRNPSDTIRNVCSSTRCEFPFQANFSNFDAATYSSVLDSGTSPDSEIINTVPDMQVNGKDIMISPPNNSICKEIVSKQKENCNKPGRKCIDKEEVDCDQIFHEVENYAEKGLRATFDNGKAREIGRENKIGGDMSRKNNVPGVVGGESMPPRNAWVSCDDCHKWRRIPALLADEIEESKCRWVCKDNMDRRYADCLIPQEKSNDEINAELEISDASGGEEAGKKSFVTENSYTAIRSNLFLNRRRKTQTVDEIMVCSCKQPGDGRLGCGHKCLNRMLNIECISGMCPCGEFCSNQQFQKRKYAKLKSMRCGKKGFGLHLLDDVSEGQFLIEYVGEVLDMHAYEARQKEYAVNGHRHFYFMTLNGSEVIDACAKGNLGRFINHSCEPNCRTEKWMVNGEVCVGIFSLRDIKKGEELTFDYNYVRVFGAAAKRCVCGSSQCRGYIGGDPLNSDIIVQGDSDEEYSEPFIVRETDDYKAPNPITIVSTSSPEEKTDGQAEISSIIIHNKVEIESSDMITKSIGTSFSPETSSGNECSELEVSLIQPEENDESSLDTYTISSKSMSDTIENFVKSKSDESEVSGIIAISKLHSSTKVSNRLSSSDKKKKPKTDIIATETKKTVEILNKSRSVPLAGPSNGRFEAVQEKLNVLLDPYGGISKRKDASRGYLKLLLLTAASEDSGNGQGIQSNRDLSMILDALLKTKSRTVLVDVINKNGLQMLHNILKRCRKEHKKIPILRKLLKVLEYLATREILTCEYINGGPRCPGMESFKDSILELTEHSDKQVHQSARNFRDRWIPWCFRKYGTIERDDVRTESHLGPPNPPDTKCEAEIPESRFKRRRKSRWDEPGETTVVAEEDVPPGFSCPVNNNNNNNNTSTSFNLLQPQVVVNGYSQPRFNSRIPVAYGVPISAVQQLGLQKEEPFGSWIISPGIPFQAFPPLPPYPRAPMNQSVVSMSEQVPMCVENPGNNQQRFMGGGCNNLPGRFFRQMKPKNPKLPPPWVRHRSNWGPPVMNDPRNGTYNPEFASVQIPHNGNYFNPPQPPNWS